MHIRFFPTCWWNVAGCWLESNATTMRWRTALEPWNWRRTTRAMRSGWNCAWVLVCAADHRQAVSEARDALQQLIERCNPKFLRDSFLLAARVCGQAAANVHGDPSLSANEREKLFERYAADAVAVLREGHEADFNFTAELQEMPEFAALRAEPDFVQLLDRESGGEGI